MEVSTEEPATILEKAAMGKKSQREVALQHEQWAAQLLEEGYSDFEKAQEHLDEALSIRTGYNEPDQMARMVFLKGCCNGRSGNYPEAAVNFTLAQQLAEKADDAMLTLSAIINRAICDIQAGNAKGAATLSRQAFVKAQAEGNSQMILVAHLIRAASYEIVGNFLAACNEHEAAEKLVVEEYASPPEPRLVLAMKTNRGISLLRSGKPERALAPFERALAIARNGLRRQPPLTLARCLFNAGEARRQARELTGAREHLEEASGIIAVETAKGEEGNRSKWAELAIEVANSKGLCTLQENAKGFRKETGMNDHDGQIAVFKSSGRRGTSVEEDKGPKKGDDEGGVEEDKKIVTAAEKAAMVLAAGAMIGESGAQSAQKVNCAILEGTAWSLAGRSHREGGAALKRADRIVKSMLERAKHQRISSGAGRAPTPAPVSDIVGSSTPTSSMDNELQLGVLSSQVLMARGGLGMGAVCTTGAVRATTGAATAGWAEAALLVKKQLVFKGGQENADSARRLSVAHAHAGAIDLVTGGPKEEVAEHFELQRSEAQKAGDAALEALAERNLGDTREAEGDLQKALGHLRRYRAIAQRARNAALEADACRRLSSMYAEIARPASLPGETTDAGDEDENGDVGETNPPPETHIEEREDNDLAFLIKNAADRARLFAERYETAVAGLQWPLSRTCSDNFGSGDGA